LRLDARRWKYPGTHVSGRVDAIVKLKVIIFGATGMVGEGVLLEALGHPLVESVLVVGRRSCEMHHPRLKEVVHRDLHDISPIESNLKGYNACFFCLGVSSVGKTEAGYTRTTYDLTLHVAGVLSRCNPTMTFCYVSGAGTDSSEQGRLMWARVKGKTENDLARLAFKAVYNFRPGFIKPIAGQKRAFRIARIAGVAHPLWRRLFPRYVCTMEDLGLSMIEVAMNGDGQRIVENRDITRLAARNRHTR
jgi:uncharacterized protein YbjT (DUF2867 family)